MTPARSAMSRERQIRQVHSQRADQLDAAVMADWQWLIEANRAAGETISETDRELLAYQGLHGSDRPAGAVSPWHGNDP